MKICEFNIFNGFLSRATKVVLFWEKRLVFVAGPEGGNRGNEGLSEADKGKERVFHNKILGDIEEAKNNKTCYEIIDATKKAIEPLKKKNGFEDMHAKFNQKLDQAREMVRTFWAGEKVANKRGVGKLREEMNGPIVEYKQKIHEVLDKPASAPAAAPTPGPTSTPETNLDSDRFDMPIKKGTETPAEKKLQEEARQERARERTGQATLTRLDNVGDMNEKIEQQMSMTALLKLAKNEKPTAVQQTRLNKFLLKIDKNSFKTVDRTEKGFPVRFVVTRSKEGDHYKVNIDVGQHPERFKPNVINENVTSAQSFLDKNGNKIPQPDKKIATFADTSKEQNKPLEKFANTPEGRLGQWLNYARANGKEGFEKAKPNILKLIEQLKLNIGVGIKTLDLGNGYRLAYGTYEGEPDPAKFKKGTPQFDQEKARLTNLKRQHQPDVVMYYMGKSVCYRHANNLNYSEPNPNRATVSQPKNYTERVAEMSAAHLTMDEALSKVRFRPGTNEPIMTPMAQKELNMAAYQLAKFNVEFPKQGYWEVKYPNSKVTMKYYQKPQEFGSFSFQMSNGSTFYLKFNSKTEKVGKKKLKVEDNQIGLKDKNGKTNFNSKDKYLMNTKEEEAYVNEPKAPRAPRTPDFLKVKPIDETNIAKTFKYDFKNPSLVLNQKDPTDLQVRFKDKKTELSTSIHDLLPLNQFKDKVVYISITNPKNPKEKPRTAMYYTGQKTFYETDKNGNQTDKQIRINNGEKIKIDTVKEPGDKDNKKVSTKFVVDTLNQYEKDLINQSKSTKKDNTEAGIAKIGLRDLKEFRKGSGWDIEEARKMLGFFVIYNTKINSKERTTVKKTVTNNPTSSPETNNRVTKPVRNPNIRKNPEKIIKELERKYDQVGHFDKDGSFAVVEKNGKQGLVDKNGKEILKPTYDQVVPVNQGRVMVKKDGKFGFVDRNEKVTVPIKYDSTTSGFTEGFAKVEINGKWGFVDKNGKEIPLEYDWVDGFQNGSARVKKDGMIFTIDKTGKRLT